MKRTIFLALTVLLIFGLSSCGIADWMLGVLYPTGDANIHIDLAVDPGIDLNLHPVIIALIPMLSYSEVDVNGILQEAFWIEFPPDGWEFRNLYRGIYRVIAYYDSNDDGKIQAVEPSVSFSNWTGEVFDFTMDEELTVLESGAYLNTFSDVDPIILNQLVNM